jgi:hypothetical protein
LASGQTAVPIPRFPPGAFSCRVDHRNQPSRSETTEKQCGTAPTAPSGRVFFPYSPILWKKTLFLALFLVNPEIFFEID